MPSPFERSKGGGASSDAAEEVPKLTKKREDA
jgi:hypothetical protein